MATNKLNTDLGPVAPDLPWDIKMALAAYNPARVTYPYGSRRLNAQPKQIRRTRQA